MTRKHYIKLAEMIHNNTRYGNIRHNTKRVIEADNFYEIEDLTLENQFNELLITSLRTKKGLNLSIIKNKFPSNFYENILHTYDQHFRLNKDVIFQNDTLTLSENGLFISDNIISEFML